MDKHARILKYLLLLIIGGVMMLVGSCKEDDDIIFSNPTISLSETTIDAEVDDVVDVNVTIVASAGFSTLVIKKFYGVTEQSSQTVTNLTNNAYAFQYTIVEEDVNVGLKFDFIVMDNRGKTALATLTINVGDSELPIPTLPDAADFVSGIDNEYLPYIPGNVYTYEGETDEGDETIVITVTSEIKTILGIECMVINDVVRVEGDVVEDTDDWFAQDKNGNVWYMGEFSEELEDGVVVSTEGSWEAGVDGAMAGIIMYGDPSAYINMPYRQEYYEGEAEDIAEIVEVGISVTIGLGTYSDCLKTREWNPLEPGEYEFKYYAPDIGLIKEEKYNDEDELEEEVGLISMGDDLPIPELPDASEFVSGIDNEYLPFMEGKILTYEGETDEGDETIVVTVTSETKTILGIECMVINDVESVDGEVVEDTDDWFAQDDDGNVWYMGEDSEELEDGVVVSTEGSWEAGVDGAKAGIVMYGDPSDYINMPYRQEYYEGEAEDIGEVVEVGISVTIGIGTYTDCVKTKEWNPLEPGEYEFKYYAPGIGLIKEEKYNDEDELEEEIELISIEDEV